jgi:thiamine biosynthesis protein ThiI
LQTFGKYENNLRRRAASRECQVEKQITTIVVHYDEIGLKGKNRPRFEHRLMRNIRLALDGLGSVHTERLYGRILVSLTGPATWQEIAERISRVFGISYFARAFESPCDLNAVKLHLREQLPRSGYESFAIQTKRSDKKFSLTSPEINRELGGFVATETGKRVDLTNPELPISVEWLHDRVLFFFERARGPGGLPLGESGKVVGLLSGGIDSPVALYLIMKRGCDVVFVHFHSFPFTNRASQRKVIEIAGELSRGRQRSRIYLVPFADLQQEVAVKTPAPYRIILYRRFMLRLAELIARKEKAQAIITGDSLSQVSSQTLSNLITIERTVDVPVIRPLIGFDKKEIIRLAQTIGTYSISIEPHDDCCAYLMPRQPSTRSTPKELERVEDALDTDGLVQRTLHQVECHSLPPSPR